MSHGIALKVLSYNIHKGFSQSNRRFVLAQIRKAIQVVHADLVLLQEVVGDHARHRKKRADWPTSSQFEFLADSVWPHYAYGKNAIYEAGHHGNAILSKYPFFFHENLNISTNPREQRGMLHCVFRLPGLHADLHTITLHLDLFRRGRLKQIEDLCQRIEDKVPHTAPLIIGGDFNDWSEDLSEILRVRLQIVEAHQMLHQSHARTFPAFLPILRLDRIYVRGLQTKAVRGLYGAPWNRLSDHIALYAELELLAKEPETPRPSDQEDPAK